MATIVGSGEYRYRIVEDWARLPDGWSFKEVGALGVDARDNVYVFNRGEHPMMVFDRDGKFLRSWGEGQYPRAHGVHMGPDEAIKVFQDLRAKWFVPMHYGTFRLSFEDMDEPPRWLHQLASSKGLSHCVRMLEEGAPEVF